MKLVNGKQGYFEQQTERRRQRLLFAFKYSTHYEIQELKQRMCNIKDEVFAYKLSLTYGMLSKIVRQYVYTPVFDGIIRLCYHITQSKRYFLKVALQDLDWEVGKMEYKTTKKD